MIKDIVLCLVINGILLISINNRYTANPNIIAKAQSTKVIVSTVAVYTELIAIPVNIAFTPIITIFTIGYFL